MIYDLIYSELITIFNINATEWAAELVATLAFILTTLAFLMFLALPLKLANFAIFDIFSPNIQERKKGKKSYFD